VAEKVLVIAATANITKNRRLQKAAA